MSRRFATSSRDEVISFRFHQAIAPIDDESTRLSVLRWTAEKHPTYKELEAKVKEARAFLAQGWTPDQLDRKSRAAWLYKNRIARPYNPRTDRAGFETMIRK